MVHRDRNLNNSLLHQFQGTLLGAALVDVTLGMQDSAPTDLGRAMVEVAYRRLGGQKPLPIVGLERLTSSLDLTLVSLPITLSHHDQMQTCSSYINYLEANQWELDSSLSLTWAAIPSLMLASILSGRYQREARYRVPKWTSMLDALPHPDRLISSLEQVYRALHEGWALGMLRQALQQRLSISAGLTNLPQRSVSEDEMHRLELLVLMLMLYSFWATPSDYGVAIARLYRNLSSAGVPTQMNASACTVLGALLGAYGGLKTLSLAAQELMHRAAPQTFLQTRWGLTQAELIDLGQTLWLHWSGVDVSRLDQPPGASMTTAAPDQIRTFGS